MTPGLNAAKFVVREKELEQALGALLAGRGMVIVGPVGVGRTAFLAAVAARLNASRYAVVWTSATEASRELPFGAFTGLLGVTEQVSQGGLVGALLRRAEGRTPVLVIDDAHYLDPASAALALGLAHEREVRLLITARPDAPMPDAVVALWKDRYLRRLDLEPFGLDGTTRLVRALLDGVAAGPTVRLLHGWTGGNPLFLTELVRHALATGRLVTEGGLWWWRGALSVPPRLAELFDGWLRGLDHAQRDALAAVALGEPLPLALLDAVAPGVVESLEERGLLRSADGDGRIVVRPAQRMLGAALRHRLPGLRRRRLCAELLTAGADAVDPVQRARWQLDADHPPEPGTLLRAAALTCRHDPELAARLARRALERTDLAAPVLAAALVELGDPDQARQVLRNAGPRARLALAAHRCWAERDPSGAHADLSALPGAAAAGLDALVLLFAGRTAEAEQTAAEALRAHGPGLASARLAHLLARVLAGRTAAAAAVAPRTGDELAGYALARLWRGEDVRLPLGDLAFGRLPHAPGSAAARHIAEAGLPDTEWSLLSGYAHTLAGEPDLAVARLREAVVQQNGGHRLFRTEAASWLAMALLAQRRPADAAAVLAAHPPDAIALLPGLSDQATGALAAARGDLPGALAAYSSAAATARSAGAHTLELTALTELRWLAPGASPDRLAALLTSVDAPRLAAEAAAALAVSRGDPGELLEHAAHLEKLGLTDRAARLAEAASSTGGDRRGEAVLLVSRLRGHAAVAVTGSVALTPREMEIAALAADGRSDREVARALGLSVRTVQSHLARIYRKLGVHSRRDLPFRR
ncbi:LuxR C-terminal-related transcriptional regulator [Crossiella cryophila]|uniref:DNA-binding CsgD family transcriptional regulator n=1 Tax=Crossiella cryophila TaxID=43355 RepID=A0A7W7C9S5_9PSEU|nr:LuxR C-terminal-related transcriptional regulator [Crossiella cryophila]MBB4677171.1 DNA-binding CsgD family transcriptional regulator [Crossiella cryophila]